MTITEPTGIDLTDPDVNHAGIPHEEYAALRRTSPVTWIPQDEDARAGMAGASGYWAVTSHADVSHVSRHSQIFSSWTNGVIIRLQPGATREAVEATRAVLINQDAPEHTLTRKIISRGFTPRALAALDEILAERAARSVSEAVEAGSGDFVEQVAARLPLETIADMLGIPASDRGLMFEWTNQIMGSQDDDLEGDPEIAAAEIMGYAMGMAAERKAEPTDDIVSKLVHAEKGDRGLTEEEFAYFVLALVVAGNETTRTAITHGMDAFFDHPDQWDLWVRERPESMIDEVIRWSTPVTSFQRTALDDTELGGQQIKAGDRVGIFYASANHDEAVFDDPFTFDIGRSPNPHVAFGGHGAHYCIGANLARTEIKLVFDALADQCPDIRRDGPANRLRSSWLNGVKSLPVVYR